MRKNTITLSIIFLLLLVCFSSRAEGQDIHKTNLWEEGEGDYASYRIPSLIVTKNNTLLAFAEGRKEHGDAGDIDLLMRRSFDNGKTWTEEQIIWDDGENTCGNPTPVVDEETGRIWLFMTWNRGEDTEPEIIQKESNEPRRPYVTYSDDDGQTWSEPKDLSTCCKDPGWGWYATGPGIGIQIENSEYKGRLIIPANHSYDESNSDNYQRFGNYGYGAHVLISDDHGETWRMSEPIRPGTNESQVVELSDGTLMMNMRSYNNEYSRAIAISTDGGETWSDIEHDHQLVESKVQASIFRYGEYEDEQMILFSNPAVPIGRTHMTIKTSFDEAETWSNSKLIYSGHSAYSSLAKLPNGNIGLFFEAGDNKRYERMTFASIPPEEIFNKGTITD